MSKYNQKKLFSEKIAKEKKRSDRNRSSSSRSAIKEQSKVIREMYGLASIKRGRANNRLFYQNTSENKSGVNQKQVSVFSGNKKSEDVKISNVANLNELKNKIINVSR